MGSLHEHASSCSNRLIFEIIIDLKSIWFQKHDRWRAGALPNSNEVHMGDQA